MSKKIVRSGTGCPVMDNRKEKREGGINGGTDQVNRVGCNRFSSPHKSSLSPQWERVGMRGGFGSHGPIGHTVGRIKQSGSGGVASDFYGKIAGSAPLEPAHDSNQMQPCWFHFVILSS